jgi:hypothetical protein
MAGPLNAKGAVESRRGDNMQVSKVFLAVMLTLVMVLSIALVANADEIKEGDKVIIVEPGNGARFCEVPQCGKKQTIAFIPEGTVLEVEGIREVNTDVVLAIGYSWIEYVREQWFQVTYEGKSGWIKRSDTEKAT